MGKVWACGKMWTSDNFHGLPKWRNLSASFDCNENVERKETYVFI